MVTCKRLQAFGIFKNLTAKWFKESAGNGMIFDYFQKRNSKRVRPIIKFVKIKLRKNVIFYIRIVEIEILLFWQSYLSNFMQQDWITRISQIQLKLYKVCMIFYIHL